MGSSVYLTHRLLCCVPRLRASGLGHSSLHLGSVRSASHSGARVQTEAECPVTQTYVLLIREHNKHTQTHFHLHAVWACNINLSHWASHSVCSDACFLSVRWIKCISHSGKHIHTHICSVPLRFNTFTIARFLFPLTSRCTGAGEDGQVRFSHRLSHTADPTRPRFTE